MPVTTKKTFRDAQVHCKQAGGELINSKFYSCVLYESYYYESQ